ncbi:hypothetical protein [Pseudomarimonas arenosa]|uniref:Uncharacterized protein n=1 Tax=Pseudomarimonas arenosa TaxID=2774145 RepID=A0AAW3ZML9_9GAMM|nr:hypothetical protein [Pseudomarimonas arenosa]MBD8526419.1 hypothetical protein [Pseudomarimonas arenosa]
MNPLKILALAVLSLVVAAVLSIAIYTEYFGPPTDTSEWHRLPSRAQSEVERIVPPLNGEKFLYYYSLGAISFEEDGNLVTDQRVVSYATYEGEPFQFESRYEDIRDISVQQGQHFLDDTVITLHHEDPDLDFELWFSVKRGLDRKIANYIRQRISQPETEPVEAAQQAINQPVEQE